ncbi:MAG: hypothetical protein IIW33_01970, partial [Oscillospiraceae bacterium]|nr:hypothetical protein [Oscillospiraceae bacterium]
MNKVFAFAKKHTASLVFLLIALLLMGRIFAFSAEKSEESQKTSEGVCYFIASVIVGGFSDLPEAEKEARVEELVPAVRKAPRRSRRPRRRLQSRQPCRNSSMA